MEHTQWQSILGRQQFELKDMRHQQGEEKRFLKVFDPLLRDDKLWLQPEFTFPSILEDWSHSITEIQENFFLNCRVSWCCIKEGIIGVETYTSSTID